jgi:hypothetical protein
MSSLNLTRIPGKYLQELANMSRERRRKWVKKNKDKLDKACREEDLEKLKKEKQDEQI